MRVRTNHMSVDECRTIAGTAVLRGTPESSISNNRVGAVELFEMEVWEARNQARNISARGLYFDRHGNRVFVVLNAEDNRQATIGGCVQRLPEFALAGCAV